MNKIKKTLKDTIGSKVWVTHNTLLGVEDAAEEAEKTVAFVAASFARWIAIKQFSHKLSDKVPGLDKWFINDGEPRYLTTDELYEVYVNEMMK